MMDRHDEPTAEQIDAMRENHDYTEWWLCRSCVGQWFVPEDFENAREQCPLCGDEDVTLMDRVDGESDE